MQIQTKLARTHMGAQARARTCTCASPCWQHLRAAGLPYRLRSSARWPCLIPFGLLRAHAVGCMPTNSAAAAAASATSTAAAALLAAFWRTCTTTAIAIHHQLLSHALVPSRRPASLPPTITSPATQTSKASASLSLRGPLCPRQRPTTAAKGSLSAASATASTAPQLAAAIKASSYAWAHAASIISRAASSAAAAGGASAGADPSIRAAAAASAAAGTGARLGLSAATGAGGRRAPPAAQAAAARRAGRALPKQRATHGVAHLRGSGAGQAGRRWARKGPLRVWGGAARACKGLQRPPARANSCPAARAGKLPCMLAWHVA